MGWRGKQWGGDEEVLLGGGKSTHWGLLRGKDSTGPKNGEGAVGSCSSFICTLVMAPGSRLWRSISLLQLSSMGLWAKGLLSEASGCSFWFQEKLLDFTTSQL